MTDAIVEHISRIDTATLSDALDRLGIHGQCLGIKPLHFRSSFTGRAYTLRYTIASDPPGTVGDYIDDVPPGAIVAIDNAGREDATVWGDILTFAASHRKIAGTVIDGACRDTAQAREIGYALFSRSVSMRTGKDRVQLDATQTPISLGGARVHPGDILRGNADGVVVVPKDREEEVARIAEEIEQREAEIRVAVTSGMRLDEARQRAAYHLLQRKVVK